MGLMCNWKNIKERDHGLTFDDVLLIPRKSEVRSRRDPSLRTKLTKTKFLETPIIAANMDTVTESGMALCTKWAGLEFFTAL
jgi:IMP dehydrogenase